MIKLPIFAKDKVNHFAYGSVIFLVMMLVLFVFPIQFLQTHHREASVSLVAVVLFAVSKEIADYYELKSEIENGVIINTNGFDNHDIVATILGGLVPFSCIWMS